MMSSFGTPRRQGITISAIEQYFLPTIPSLSPIAHLGFMAYCRRRARQTQRTLSHVCTYLPFACTHIVAIVSKWRVHVVLCLCSSCISTPPT